MVGSSGSGLDHQYYDALSSPVSSSSSSAHNYHVWVTPPTSVQQRKYRFLKLMNFTFLDDDRDHESHPHDPTGFDNTRILETGDAVLRTPVFDQLSSSLSDSSSTLTVSNDNFISRPTNSDCTTSSDPDGCKPSHDSPPLVHKLVDRQIKVAATMARSLHRVKSQWLSRLRSMTCVDDAQGRFDGAAQAQRIRVQRVKVRHNKKRPKELSAVFSGQDIQAHQGSILTMKFSQGGCYLSTGGEDGVVRIWQVVEDDRSNDIDIPDIDPSCLYFTVNHLSELSPLMAEKQKLSMLQSIRKTADSACVIVPPKVFRILEKPVHEFHGHNGEVLDLSWSNDNLLLSSSVDESVRLWRVGNDQCLKVFPHSNYVTCVQFNPVDEGYFISGSIDGKVRIWSIGSSQVVDWTEIREIVSAVTYNPDGKGGIIGSMTGCCRLFSLSDNHFQLEASVCLNSKKKSPCKRIIGFQFCPQDESKVMVTCADSHVRILHGINVIAKYKGLRNGGNQLSASFTSDGKHIVSVCEDSNVYFWNCNSQKDPSLYQQKTVRSFECFSSDASSVVLPWSGLKVSTSGSGNGWNLQEGLPNSSPSYFSLGKEFFLESIAKGSATWPEEKLPGPPPGLSPPLCKSQYKFFKSCCQSSAGCHAWGLVIVTAGWDGHIRSFLNYGLPVTL